MGYIRYTVSFQYTFKEHDPKICYPYRILGFRICFFCFPGATKLKCQSQSHLRHQKKRIKVSFVASGTKIKGRSFSAFPDLLE